jgi:asparagine synthase (glutamine-hydrolysing)
VCGIVGLLQFRLDRAAPDLCADLRAMTQALRHRGPDGEGAFVSPGGRCALGHRRLSIIDLSAAGRQPMATPDGRFWITYNGEVYNYLELRDELAAAGYTFTSRTDTEVVLAAYQRWGVECLERFNGMFALAIWDERAQQLFLARDRLGIKPLYYVQTPSLLAFASEVKALLALPYLDIRPSERAIVEFLEHMYAVGTAETFFEPVYRLEPAHYWLIDPRAPSSAPPRRYWRLDLPTVKVPFSRFKEVQAAFQTLLREAVRLQLRSDVPVGVCLSGGLDSSTIVGLLAHEGLTDIKTFSAYFPVESYDESPYFRAVVRHFGVTAYEVQPRPEDAASILPEIVWHLEEPSPHFGVIPQWYVVGLARGRVKVLLDGQGGDETLGGYHSYLPAFLSTKAAAVARRPWPWAVLGLWRELRAAETLAGRRFRSALWAGVRRKGRANGAVQQHRPTVVADACYAAVARFPLLEFTFDHTDFDDMLTSHLTRSSLPSLLRDEDKIAMAFSIENRVPLLDHRLVEFVFTLDPSYKVHMGWTKYLLRRTMEGILPESVTWRPDKKGYPTPLREWLATPGNPMHDLLRAVAAQRRPWLDGGKIAALHARHRAGERDATRILWRTIAVEMWYQRFWER